MTAIMVLVVHVVWWDVVWHLVHIIEGVGSLLGFQSIVVLVGILGHRDVVGGESHGLGQLWIERIIAPVGLILLLLAVFGLLRLFALLLLFLLLLVFVLLVGLLWLLTGLAVIIRLRFDLRFFHLLLRLSIV